MSEIAVWLRAKLDEEEATILRTSVGKVGGSAPQHTFYEYGSDLWSKVGAEASSVLRHVAAGRKLLELHSGEHECPSVPEVYRAYVVDGEPCDTIKVEAERWGWHG